MKLKIAILEGDGIGPEIMKQVRTVAGPTSPRILKSWDWN